jgi:hypothetical protein
MSMHAATVVVVMLFAGCKHQGSGDVDLGPDDGAVVDVDLSTDDVGPPDGFISCGSGTCPNPFVCKYGLCLPNLGTCTTNDDCPGDSYCDSDGTCVPYGVPPDKINDPTCTKSAAPPNITPMVKCEWTAPAAADPTLAYVNVYTAPLVANLNLGNDLAKLEPSIVMTTWANVNGRSGVLRVFDGRTCTEQMRIGGPDDADAANNRPAYGTQWAIGDLDGDVGTATGHPEIVGLHRIGFVDTTDKLTLIAFSIDTSTPGSPKLVRKWLGRICGSGGNPDTAIQIANIDDSGNFGPGIWDLDDDGKPEIVLDKLVFDQNGCLLNPPAQVTSYVTHGAITTVADVDLDGKPDLVAYDGVYDWNTGTQQWTLKPYFTQTAANSKPGHVAIANLGNYSTLPAPYNKVATDPVPEIVVVSAQTSAFNPSSTGTLRVMTVTGQIVFGPIDLFHQFNGTDAITNFGGHGGPPTIGDFDGDGQLELAAAANQFYTVYDPDCKTGGAAERPGGKCDRTGVTEPAFVTLPLPDGILWAKLSQDYSSSETGSSIFDFNGDGTAEAVYRDECYLRVYDGKTGNVIYSAPASSGTGQELPVVADVSGTFSTRIVVARANNGGACPSPDPLFAGSGAFVTSSGFEVLADPLDRWVSSRPIWNQHAYSVTNVGDRGEIPRSSLMKRNWEQPGLNNFRQNVQGALGKTSLAGFTVELTDLSSICMQSGAVPLTAKVCNRGTNPAPNGVEVDFYTKDPASMSDAGVLVCSGTTQTTLAPGDCTQVMCTGTISSDSNIVVVVDPNDLIPVCHPGNKVGAGSLVLCPPPIL